MNQRVLKLWIKALRSNIYNQGHNYLRRKNKFCCLGVLVDLYIKEHNLEWHYAVGSIDNLYEFGSSSSTLPAKVIQWAGLSCSDPVVYHDGFRYTLSLLNDCHCMSFNKIAKILRDNYETRNPNKALQCS